MMPEIDAQKLLHPLDREFAEELREALELVANIGGDLSGAINFRGEIATKAHVVAIASRVVGRPIAGAPPEFTRTLAERTLAEYRKSLDLTEAAVREANAQLAEAVELLRVAVENLEQTLRFPEGWECSEEELIGDARTFLAKLAPKSSNLELTAEKEGEGDA